MSRYGIGGIKNAQNTAAEDAELIEQKIKAEERAAKKVRVGFGSRGIRYDENCDRCHRMTDVCNWCGCCEKHCTC